MSTAVSIEQFLITPGPILDARSPGEFQQGHVPGAVSFPLFSDSERAEVGTCYKHQGRDAAVELGFEIAGPKCAAFVRRAKGLAPDRQVRLHCWRGGMRSGGMGWILGMAGLEVTRLAGGYKAYRRWVRQQLAKPRSLIVLGGMTGTSKTEILRDMVTQGAQMLDLEGLANHRGSSFGALEMPPQPSTEHYENLISDQLTRLHPDRPTWVEAESRRVGTCRVPDEFFRQMEAAPTLEVVRPVAERLDHLVNIYGEASIEGLVQATERIRKRLGGQRTQAAIAHIRRGQLREASEIILDYYDRTYRYDLERREKVIPQIDIAGCCPAVAAQKLLSLADVSLGSQPEPGV